MALREDGEIGAEPRQHRRRRSASEICASANVGLGDQRVERQNRLGQERHPRDPQSDRLPHLCSLGRVIGEGRKGLPEQPRLVEAGPKLRALLSHRLSQVGRCRQVLTSSRNHFGRP